MIICGFPGIGKSTICRNQPGVIDLESTPFEKDWDRYIKVAKHMNDQGYHVMISCHKALRTKLHNQNIRYIIILPTTDQKEDYLARYQRRGNTKEFIDAMDKNWMEYTTIYPWEEKFYLKKDEFISDYRDYLDSLKYSDKNWLATQWYKTH